MMNTQTPDKFSPHELLLQCFELAMDEKMLDYLLAVGTEPHTREALETLYHAMYDDGKWTQTWEEIMLMSFLIPNHDSSQYILAAVFPGWIELSASGPLNEKRRAILNKFKEYWDTRCDVSDPRMRRMNDIGAMMALQISPPPLTTYAAHGPQEITLDQPLTSRQQVFTGGELIRLLARHRDQIAVMNCFCRQHRQINGGGECEAGLPVESCMSIGSLSRQLVSSGVARPPSL